MIFGRMMKMKRDEIKNNFEELTKRLGIGLDQVVRVAQERMSKDVDYKKEVIAVLDAVGNAVEQVKAHLQEEE
jgi:hypothetical protein